MCCVQCFYKHSGFNMCKRTGCKKELAKIQQKIANGEVGEVDLSSSAEAPEPEIASTGGASSSRDDQARNSQQTIQALKDDVAQLKETVRGM